MYFPILNRYMYVSVCLNNDIKLFYSVNLNDLKLSLKGHGKDFGVNLYLHFYNASARHFLKSTIIRMQVVKGKKDNEKCDYCILLIIRQLTHTFWMIIGNAFRKLCQQQRKKKMTNIVTMPLKAKQFL